MHTTKAERAAYFQAFDTCKRLDRISLCALSALWVVSTATFAAALYMRFYA